MPVYVDGTPVMTQHRLLFICTHNRCRSILAEAIARQVGEGAIEAASAGSAPAGEVFPMTLTMLEAHGYATSGLVSESWHDKAAFAPTAVITVCDSAAGEVCPLWMGSTEKLHWGLPDPSKIEDADAQREAFESVIRDIEQRIRAFLEQT